MKICCNWHDEIVYSSEGCPLCAAISGFETTLMQADKELAATVERYEEALKQCERAREQP